MAIVISGTTGIDAGSLPVANTGKISAGSGLPVILNTAGVDRVTVDTAGNVGIGTSSPTFEIDALGGNGNGFRYSNGTVGNVLGVGTLTGQVGTVTNHSLELMINGATKATLDANGNLLLTSGTGGLGYGTGAGGIVTQLTSKSTAVTLNKPSGRITMNNAALAAGATVYFILFNNLMGPSDTLTLSIPNLVANDIFNYRVTYNLYNGGAIIFVTNISGSSLSEAISIHFNVHKVALA